MNPMIAKELRERMRERRSWTLPSVYLLLLSGAALFAYFISTQRGGSLQGSDVGMAVFFTVAYSQLTLLLLVMPVFSAGAITIEKEQKTLASLLTTLLGPSAIWTGKFVAALLYALLLMFMALPLLAVALMFGGVGPTEVMLAVITTVIILTTMTAVGLFWSSIFKRTVHATAVTYGTAAVLSVLTFVLFLGLMELHRPSNSNWGDMPLGVKLPMYFNPFFYLTVSFSRIQNLYPEWVRCTMLWVATATLAAAAGMRNLSRRSEES
jgi:ABC-2 type transport system permease protein